MLGITWGEESVSPEHQRRNARDAMAAGFPTPVPDPAAAAADASLPGSAACAQSKGIVNQPIRLLFPSLRDQVPAPPRSADPTGCQGFMRLLGHLHRSRRALERVTTPVRALVQTGGRPQRGYPRYNLAREGDAIGLTAEAGGLPTLRADLTREVPPARLAGSARPNYGLTTVVTGHGLRYPVEISENSQFYAVPCFVRSTYDDCTRSTQSRPGEEIPPGKSPRGTRRTPG